jgi:hypothetical protein
MGWRAASLNCFGVDGYPDTVVFRYPWKSKIALTMSASSLRRSQQLAIALG